MQNYLFSFLLAFILATVIAPLTIYICKKIKFGQNILGYVENHKSKQGTPTMGGIIFILPAILAALLFAEDFYFVLTCSVLFLGFGILGFLDDLLKVSFKRNLGLKPYQKILGQLALSLIAGFYVFKNGVLTTNIFIPFFNTSLDIGALIIVFVVFIFIASSNSVNLTDGLDGLAGGISFVYFIVFGLLCYLFYTLNSHLILPFNLPKLTSICVVSFALAGALLAFLIFNSHPAKIFMGDTGSLALGAMVAITGCFSGLSLFIMLLGIMFVLSTVSVIIQVLYFKITKGKRIFLMAPYHHHLEQKGMYETKIVAIYIIVTIVVSISTILLSIKTMG